MSEEFAKRKRTIRIGIWIALTAVAVVYLVVSSIRGTQLPYVNASELSGAVGRHVRVAGLVAAGSIESSGPGDVSIRFVLADEHGDTVRVAYTGVRPDAFREGAQAVVEGAYHPDRGLFEAVLLQAKCPSKYEVGVAGANGTKT